MPGSFLNDTERERLRGFPTEIPPEDLIGYFTLSERDQLLRALDPNARVLTVWAENPVTSRDLHVFVDEAAQSVSS